MFYINNGTIIYTPTCIEQTYDNFPPPGIFSSSDTTAYDILELAIEAEADSNYAEAYNLFNQIIEDFPEEEGAIRIAMPHILSVGSRISVTYDSLYNYFNNIYAEYGSSPAGKTARVMRNDCSIEMENYYDAINDYESIMNDPNSTLSDSVFAVLEAENAYMLMNMMSVTGPLSVGTSPSEPDIFQEYMELEEELLKLLSDRKSASTVDGIEVPDVFALHQNYPNPFNPTTNISYDLPEQATVKLTIYNVLGQNVITLIDGIESAGYRRAVWDGKSMSGTPVSSGLYICRIEAVGKVTGEKFSSVKKMLMLK